MQFEVRLVHAEAGRRVVEVRAIQAGQVLGSALGEADQAETAEDRALARLRQRLGADRSPPADPATPSGPLPLPAGLLAAEPSTALSSRAPTGASGPAGPAGGSAAEGTARLSQGMDPRREPPAAPGQARPALVQGDRGAAAAPGPRPDPGPGPGRAQASDPGSALKPGPAPGPAGEPGAGARGVGGPAPARSATTIPAAAAEGTAAGERASGAGSAQPDDAGSSSEPQLWPQGDRSDDPDDWSAELARLDLSLRRIGWSREQEADYLRRAFGHPSRSRITSYSDLQAYLRMLDNLQAGADPLLAAVPLRRRDLMAQSETLLLQLGWDEARARRFSADHLDGRSRQQLNDEQLLQCNLLLEAELIAASEAHADPLSAPI